MRPLQTRHALPRGAACIAAAAALLAALPLPAVTARMPLEEVRPGMTGTGITVFEGTTRDRFDVHVLGMLMNAVGPAPPPHRGAHRGGGRSPRPGSSRA